MYADVRNFRWRRASKGWEDPSLWFDARGNWHIMYHVYATEPFSKHHELYSGHAYSTDGQCWCMLSLYLAPPIPPFPPPLSLSLPDTHTQTHTCTRTNTHLRTCISTDTRTNKHPTLSPRLASRHIVLYCIDKELVQLRPNKGREHDGT